MSAQTEALTPGTGGVSEVVPIHGLNTKACECQPLKKNHGKGSRTTAALRHRCAVLNESCKSVCHGLFWVEG